MTIEPHDGDGGPSAVVTADGRRWRQARDGVALDGSDRTKQRFGAGSTAFVSADSGGLGVRVRDTGAEVDLRFDGFYDAMPVWNSPEAHEAAQTIAPHHAESSGRARGTVRQKSFLAVEGLGEVRLDGSDEVGFCDLEMSNGVGHREVTRAVRAVTAEGLSRR